MLMDTTNQPLIEMVSTDQLKPDPKNPRTISQHEFEDLQRSIDQFGIAEPLVVNRRNRTIVGGHQRIRAAKALGLGLVPVVWVDLDEAHQTTLNIGLNKLGGEFDLDTLPELILQLDEELQSMTGFSEEEIAKLQADPFDEEEKPKPEKVKIAKYSLAELRELAESFHPERAGAVIEFLDWIKERES